MAVQFDKLASRISRDENGNRIDRVAIVTGVTGNADQKLINALNDAQMPSIGDAHPQDSTITLRDIQGEVIDTETVRVVLSYYQELGTATGEANATVRAWGASAPDQTDVDINGNRLHFYTLVGVNGTGIITNSRAFTAEVERPRLTLDFEYTSTAFPIDNIKTYYGKVNSIPWNGYKAKSMLCSNINATQEGSGYRVTMSFSENADTWQFHAAIKEPNMNLPASDNATNPDPLVDKFDAAKKFEVYESVDFTPLGFDLGIDFAEISGTAAAYPKITEADIVAGGETLIITLYGGETWVASGATFDAQRQNIIDGLVSNKSESAGWDAEIALGRIIGVTNVVRTSDTVVTITMVADAAYVITEPENISVTIPASALTLSATDMTPATTFFTINGS